MEDPEVPLEECQEHIEEHAREHGGSVKWISGVALSTALFAAIAAVASLLAGRDANDAMIAQIKASDDWNYFQAKGIEAGVLGAKIDLMRAAEHNAATAAQQSAQSAEDAGDAKKFEEYAGKRVDISRKAKEEEADSTAHLARHEKLAFSVTLFQIAIAISAIAVLTRKRPFWFVGLVFGGGGVLSLVTAYW